MQRPVAARISRRRLVGSAAWTAPTVVLATAAPAFAASTTGIEVSVARTSSTATSVTYLATVINNTGAPVNPFNLNWTFTKTAGDALVAGPSSSDFTLRTATGTLGTVISFGWLRNAPLPMGSSASIFTYNATADYRATVALTSNPATGPESSAATTYEPSTN